MRFPLLGILLTLVASASATEQFRLYFEIAQGENKIECGGGIVSHKPHTLSKGLKRSYLKMLCKPQESGKTHKTFSTEDHFAGVLVTHQLVGDEVKLKVVHSAVQPRLVEIHALPRSECKDLSPVVDTTSATYVFPAKDGIDEARPFGENMTFRATLQSIGGDR